MSERWKDVVGYEGYYRVSNQGRVKSLSRQQRSYGGRVWLKPEKMLRATFDGRYSVVSLTVDGVKVRPYIHDLVLTAFKGERPDGLQGCHKNGVGSDNRLRNLRWGTPKSNHDDRVLHGTLCVGVKHGMNKYSESQIKKVKRLLTQGVTASAITEATGVPVGTVYQVKHGRQWKHL